MVLITNKLKLILKFYIGFQVQIKFFFLFNLLISSLLALPLRHEIVFLNGQTQAGRVVEFTRDTLIFEPQLQKVTVKVAMDGVLYIHNSEGKLFFISDHFWRYIDICKGRGGKIITINGQEIPYVYLRDEELRMYTPELIYYQEKDQNPHTIYLENVHKLIVDRSISGYAVRKGFYVGAGIALFRYLIQFRSLGEFLEFNLLYNRAYDLLPSTVVTVPLITLGWVIYDYFYEDREFLINPPEVKNP